MKREIISINEELCDGCGLCVPNCPEGAIRVVEGKARLTGDIFCDGLGACLGNCPKGAITIEKREAEPYNERKAMENIIAQGSEAVLAHLRHLEDHGEKEYHREAVAVLRERGLEVPVGETMSAGLRGTSASVGSPVRDEAGVRADAQPHGGSHGFGGCPGSRSFAFGSALRGNQPSTSVETRDVPDEDENSALTHWPVQLHLVNPRAPHYVRSNLLLAADCVAFSLGNFHSSFLSGKTLAIACPKLDAGKEEYVEKLRMLIDEARVETITVMMMEVPCCGGLLELARAALRLAARKVPLKKVIVSLRGGILQEEWV